MAHDIVEDFGKRIKKLRLQRKWSQEELAFRSGLDDGYLSDVECGKKEPCLRKIKDLSKALKVSLSKMMDRL